MSSISVSPRTLADVLPGGVARSVALVVGGAGLVGLAAQASVPLPFTPVPLSLSTLAVLLVGAALGSRRGAASMALYVLAGVAGVPWFSAHHTGWAFSSFGYVVGYVLAAWIVGRLAERGADRHVLRTAGVMVLGNLAIYAVGVPGLMLAAGLPLGRALLLGVVPFLLGDALKIVVAAGLLPAAWKLVGQRR
jgi:biotin transport system substrate-specific component